MKLTAVLCTAPRFHFWRDFGAGRRKRMPYFKHWWDQYRFGIARTPILDHTIPVEHLPPNSRLMDAEDFMVGHIDQLPDDLIKRRDDPKTIYDHPWPFNVQVDPIKNQELMYCYDMFTRFFVPQVDALALTNTILETDKLKARPPFEPNEGHLNYVQRQYQWSTEGDSILARKPKSRIYPRIDQVPMASYGITKERLEVNVMALFADYSQNLLAQFHHEQQNRENLSELLDRKSISFPHCHVPMLRDSRKKINLQLCIDFMSLGNKPLPIIDGEPQKSTSDKQIVDIKPRTWRSILEQSRNYSPSWSFTLPRACHLNTIQLASRIKRDYRDSNEMLARAIVHSFGLTVQYSRLRCYEKLLSINSSESKLSSVVLPNENPLEIEAIRSHDSRAILEKPVVLQTIAYDSVMKQFHFIRYQLNTANLDDSAIKNQAWYSGPITDLGQVFRYYLDFQSFDEDRAKRTLLETDHDDNDRALENRDNVT